MQPTIPTSGILKTEPHLKAFLGPHGRRLVLVKEGRRNLTLSLRPVWQHPLSLRHRLCSIHRFLLLSSRDDVSDGLFSPQSRCPDLDRGICSRRTPEKEPNFTERCSRPKWRLFHPRGWMMWGLLATCRSHFYLFLLRPRSSESRALIAGQRRLATTAMVAMVNTPYMRPSIPSTKSLCNPL